MNTTNPDKAHFADRLGITKKICNSVIVEGREVPIVHQYGKDNLTSYPTLRVGFAKFAAIFAKKAGVPVRDKFMGSETLIVEKYKEVYHAGIGNNAVHKLACKGYDFRRICEKIGRPLLTEINITHAIKAWSQGKINLMLNEGIDEAFDLLTETNAADYYTNTLARMGVGNDATAASATNTGLLGGSTAFAAMEGGFPNLATAQRVDFKGSFASGLAEFAWEEFSVDNGVTPNANLQRLVSSKGTKSSGETWTAEIQITGS